MPAFDSHQAGDLALGLRAPNVRRRSRKDQFVRMPLDRAIDGVDHVERAPRCAAMRDVPGLDVERKELGSHAALLHPRDVGAVRIRRHAAQIVIVVGHRRGDIVVRVDDDRPPLNLKRSLPERFIARRTH